jgi:pterin-4a-carbinolamine dehydratase
MDRPPPTGWTLRENALVRTIQRRDFVEAMAFLLAVGWLAEADNHHPDVDLR